MLFKKNKVVLKNIDKCTHLIINGIDLSKYITEYKITQEGGEIPKLTIVCSPQKLDMVIDELKEIKVKTTK